MNTKNLLLAGMLLTGTSAMAKTDAPEICKSVANYTTIAMDMRFTDGTWEDAYDPARLHLTKDFNRYPISKVTYLGSCDDNYDQLKKSWCNIAGGPAEVYKIEVSNREDDGHTYPQAEVVVTFNRGSCKVNEATNL